MSDPINESLATSVLRLGNECRELAKERDALKEHIRYLEIELNCETGRWERTMEENARLKEELARLRTSSFVTAVPVEEYEKLKADFHQAHDERVDYAKDVSKLKAEVERYKFTLEEERQIARQDWAGLRCEHDRVKRALQQAEAENERLKSLCDNLGMGGKHTVTEIEAQNTRLKDDLDYVRKMRTKETLDLQEMSDIVNETRAENARLKAEVERLRKTGDAMESEGGGIKHNLDWEPVGWNDAVKAWNAAKEKRAVKAWNAANEDKPSV